MRGALENQEQKPHPPVGLLQRPLLTEFDIELAGKGEICEFIQLQLSQDRETKCGSRAKRQYTENWHRVAVIIQGNIILIIGDC